MMSFTWMGVDGMFVEGPPCVIVGVFFPDDDGVVVWAGGKEAEAGVGPGDLPDGAFVPEEDVVGAVRHLPVGAHLEHPHSLVFGRRCEAPAIIIEFNVMLNFE